jgi:hypothetical protein
MYLKTIAEDAFAKMVSVTLVNVVRVTIGIKG